MVNLSSQPIDETTYYAQLTQVRVPLEHAADAFTQRAASGSIPIVVVPERPFRLRLDLVGLGVAAIVAGIIAANMGSGAAWVSLLIIVGLLLVLLAFYRVLRIFVPEGVQALLASGGRYTRTISSGPHFIPPWIAITHLVTRREIPFDVVVVDAPTQDNVRARLDTLFTFTISDPYRFVYNISADDFDRVFQATCQDSLRSLVRQITSDQVNDLVRHDLSDLRQDLSAEAESYGITIMRVNIISAQPPDDFMRSQEARQLAIVQQAEQAEQQALALRRQRDQADLARQEVIARVDREREALQLQIQQVEMRQRVTELEAKIEEFRLARLEERLHNNPLAARWEWQGDQLAVARALAGNTRAVVQLGNTDALVRTILARDFNGSAIDPQTLTDLIHEDQVQLERNE
jgi:regulator of protease activity HflC (stomatin/prohibitin superfamily)